MIKLVNKEDIKEADKNTWSRIKSIDLMEDAGYKMYKRIKNNLINKKIIIVLGKGGNAGDGLVVARYLYENNYDVSVYLLDELSSDALINLNRYKGNILKELNLANYDIIIDAIFGVGLSRYLDDKYINIINLINDSNKYIISLDMPSGIDATSGISYGAYIKCNLLLTVEYLKLGLFLNDGLSSYDDYKIIKINLDKPKHLYNLLELKDFKNIYPKRLNNTHKGSFGKATIIAGSSKYPGASIISYNSLISFMMGLGYQRLYVVKELYDKYQYNPEIIVNKIDSNNGIIKYNENDLNEIIKSSDTISIGMGMDISIDLYNSIKYLLNNFKDILILDADALNTISKYGIDILNNKKCDVILTPHLAEFKRLLNNEYDLSYIKENMINLALDFSSKYHINLILKSASEIITDGNNLYINYSGNTALAKAGSGDALSGILTGVTSYLKCNLIKKMSYGAFLHGYISRLATKDYEEECLTISKIIEYIPKAIRNIKRMK